MIASRCKKKKKREWWINVYCDSSWSELWNDRVKHDQVTFILKLNGGKENTRKRLYKNTIQAQDGRGKVGSGSISWTLQEAKKSRLRDYSNVINLIIFIIIWWPWIMIVSQKNKFKSIETGYYANYAYSFVLKKKHILKIL